MVLDVGFWMLDVECWVWCWMLSFCARNVAKAGVGYLNLNHINPLTICISGSDLFWGEKHVNFFKR
jgi:hypothetical protein